jgi:hypothetical protein
MLITPINKPINKPINNTDISMRGMIRTISSVELSSPKPVLRVEDGTNGSRRGLDG